MSSGTPERTIAEYIQATRASNLPFKQWEATALDEIYGPNHQFNILRLKGEDRELAYTSRALTIVGVRDRVWNGRSLNILNLNSILSARTTEEHQILDGELRAEIADLPTEDNPLEEVLNQVVPLYVVGKGKQTIAGLEIARSNVDGSRLVHLLFPNLLRDLVREVTHGRFDESSENVVMAAVAVKYLRAIQLTPQGRWTTDKPSKGQVPM